MAKSREVAIVAGVRTPFAKRGTTLASLSPLELGVFVTAELLQRAGLAPSRVEQVVFGQVLANAGTQNIARDIALASGLPCSVDAFSVSRACASGYQAIASVADGIRTGAIDCGVAGATESTSRSPLSLNPKLAAALRRVRRLRFAPGELAALLQIRPRDLLPINRALSDPSTGMTMTASAENLAKRDGIARLDQDRFAHRSHTLAAAAWADGRLAEEVMPLFLPAPCPLVQVDNGIRPRSSLAAYARLPPLVDRRHGTLTEGNSALLTDGAGALMLMNREAARAEGIRVLATVRGYAFVAVDPVDEAQRSSVYAMRLALDRAKLRLKDLDLVDMHEPSAAQVLSVVSTIESRAFARTRLNQDKPIGRIDWDRFNVMGGSIALGHPLAATGIRQVLQTANQLRRSGGEFALCVASAAGGLGAAMILEAA